jgi:hypothetical protein
MTQELGSYLLSNTHIAVGSATFVCLSCGKDLGRVTPTSASCCESSAPALRNVDLDSDMDNLYNLYLEMWKKLTHTPREPKKKTYGPTKQRWYDRKGQGRDRK